MAFGTPSLEDSVEFYRQTVRLTVSERQKGTVFLTGDKHHHWIRLEENAPTGLLRIGFQAVSEEALENVKQDLKSRGIEVKENVSNINNDRIDNSIRFMDPGGFEIELYTEMAALGISPFDTGVNFERLLHAVWASPDVNTSYDFYNQVLGFKASDWIDRNAVFMHCADRYHHGIAILGNKALPGSTFNHFCMHVESFDDVMKYRENAIRVGAQISSDLTKHSPSGSIAVYLKDPILGHNVEYCTNHRQFDDDTESARVIPALSDAINVWSRALPDVGPDHSLDKADA
jgi:catechol 2,3-dioxygenase-like lactoylglutathione lyase family enzyme